MSTYKTYNFKMDKETYLKLKEIELDFEKNNSKKKTKSEILAIIIKGFKKSLTPEKQTSILD